MSTVNPRKRGAPLISPSPRQPVTQTHDRKRLKLQDARSIAVQSAEETLKGGQLDINAFIRSREFEIRALEEAMGNSKRANNKRAFQSVPRSMRRRTASHNVKKVPKRLRSRHAKEMADDNTPTVTSRRRKPTSHMRLRLETAKRLQKLSQSQGKRRGATVKDDAVGGNTTLGKIPIANELRNPPAPKSKFRKRQVQKTWLPTHIWHAKRAHMVARWRYAIAERPTEKCYRPTHRASTLRGCIAWDRSYYSTILVKGKGADVANVLREICSPDDALTVCENGPIRKGKRVWEGWVYEKNAYPTKPIAPITILWCAPPPKPGHTSESEVIRSKKKSIPLQQVLLRVHPSSFFQLWMTTLAVARSYSSVTIEDLRFECGSIEIAGPSATDALLSVLQPRNENPEVDSPEAVWQNLRSLTNPSSLPPGAYLGFNIMDPRLRFPPRLSPLPQYEDSERLNKLFSVISTWPPDRTITAPDFFSREARAASVQAQGSQKKINERKSQTVPGQSLALLPTDPYIPILAIANRYRSPLRPLVAKSFSASASNAVGGWTVLLPWKWVLPVWYSLVHVPGVRFGGIDQCRQLCHENSVGSFPDDFPGTKAGMAEEERKAAERKELWEKKPKQKRIAWESVDLGAKRRGELGRGGWCDWEYLIGDIVKRMEVAAMPPPPIHPLQHPVEPNKLIFTSPAGEDDSSVEIDPHSSTTTTSIPPAGQIPPPIPSSTDTTTASSSISFPPQISKSPFHNPSHPWTVPTSLIPPILLKPHDLFPTALSQLPKETLARGIVSVGVTFLHRGAPSERARIYRLPTVAAAKRDPTAAKIREGWLALLASYEAQEKTRRSRIDHDAPVSGIYQDMGASRRPKPNMPIPPPVQPGHERYPVVPGEEDLIGFVTSGDFNLKEGRGTGVGAIAFVRVFGGVEESTIPEAYIRAKEKKKRKKGKATIPLEGGGAVSRICVVRDVGNRVGRLARWEII